MKTLRLAEILLPLLAARGWAPWAVEPKSWTEQLTLARPITAASHGLVWRDRGIRRALFDDVQ